MLPTRNSQEGQAIFSLTAAFFDSQTHEFCGRTKNKTTRESVGSLSPSFLIEELKRGGIDDATVVESGMTKVLNRDAYFAVISYSIQTMGERIPVKTVQVITTKRDMVYTFSCGTVDPNAFSSTYPIFRTIIGSLFIDP